MVFMYRPFIATFGLLILALLIPTQAFARVDLRKAGDQTRFRVIQRFPDSGYTPAEVPIIGESSPFYPIIGLVEKKDWPNAFELFGNKELELALQKNPLQQFLAGYVALQADKPHEAFSYFEDLEQTLPDFADSIHFYSAQAALRQDEPHQAALKAAQVSPESRLYPDALLLLARALHNSGEASDLERTAEVLELYLAKFSARQDAAEARHLLAEVYLALDQKEEAARSFLYLRDHFPLHRRAAQADNALQSLKEKLGEELRQQIDQESTERILNRYRAHFDRHQSQLVIDELGQKLEQFGRGSDERCESLYLVARSYTKLRRHSDGTPVYDRLLRECRKTSWEIRGLYLGGRGRWNEGDREGAMKLFERIWTEYPDHSFADDAMYFTARILRSEDRPEEADAMLRRQIERYPDGDMAKDAHWLTLRQLWDQAAFDEIVAYVDGLQSLGEDDLYSRGRLHYFRARALEEARDLQKAQTAFEQVIRDYPKTYYSLLAFNRLASLAPQANSPGVCASTSELCDELLPTSREARPIPIPSTLRNNPIFRRGIQMLSVGLVDLARAELNDLRAHYRNDPQTLWALASLLDRAGSYPLSHDMARRHIPGWMDEYPTQSTRARWLVAYPTPFRESVQQFATQRRLNPALIYAIMREESGFSPRIESWANARGLLQLIEDTARSMAHRDGLSLQSFDQLFEPQTNIQLGSAFLHTLSERFHGHPALIIAGYNAGVGNVSTWLNDAPADLPLDIFVEDIPFGQTRDYTKRVLMSFWIYNYLYGDERVPALLFSLPR